MTNDKTIEKIFNSLTASKQIHEVALLVEYSSCDFSASYAHGGKTIDTLFNSSSVGKLFTTISHKKHLKN